jgi:hypothetical protein
MLIGYKDTLDKGLESNRESIQSYYDSCKSIIEVLQKQLDEENLSSEEKKYIIDKMLEISKVMGEKDSVGTKFELKELLSAYWGTLTDTQKQQLGKDFYLDVVTGVYSNIKFTEKGKNNHAFM